MFSKGNTVWKGKKHTEETRRKMSEAARRRWAGKLAKAGSGYRLLIAAIVRQAIKDGDAGFFETDAGMGYCDEIGISPAVALHNMRSVAMRPRRNRA